MAITPIIPGSKVREAYAKASPETVAVFDAESTTTLTDRLGLKYPAFDQDLGSEVGYLILGLTTITEFRSRLMQIKSDEAALSDIVATVTKQILLPMQNPSPKKEEVPAPISNKTTAPTKPVAPKVVVELPPAPAPVRRTAPALPTKPTAVVTQNTVKLPPPPQLPQLKATPVPVVPPRPQQPPVAQKTIPSMTSPTQPPTVPLKAPIAHPRVVVAPHKMRTMERDAASAKGHPGKPLYEKPPEKQRPVVWDGAPAQAAPPPPQKPETPVKPVDPYREPLT